MLTRFLSTFTKNNRSIRSYRNNSLVLLLLLLLSGTTTHDAVRIVKDPQPERRRVTQQEPAEQVSQPLSSAANEFVSSSLADENGNIETTTTSQQHRRLKSSSRSVPVPTHPDEHLVTEPLPLWSGDPFPTQHWAGHLPASSDGTKFFFYWLFAPDLSSSNRGSSSSSSSNNVEESSLPLIIWINGGPGCSSMDGLFLENGPFRLVQSSPANGGDYVLTAANTSWHQTPAYTMYIDQPVGTGLSFVTTQSHYPTNDEEVNIDFYAFLQSFFHLHADKFVSNEEVNRPLYFSGESHAGHYIPSLMNYILQKNNNLGADQIRIPLAGAAIGNGWVDPYYQYAAAEAAYGHGLVDRAQVNALNERELQCQQKLSQGSYNNGVCFSLLDLVLDQSFGNSANFKVSSYDARFSEARNGDRVFPPGHKVLETYLGGWALAGGGMSTDVAAQVLSVIHATAAGEAGLRYQECTDPPYDALVHQDGKGVVPDVVSILEHPDNVKLLFFNGMEDLICNHVGNEKMLENLSWKGQSNWVTATRYVWTAPSEVPGRVSGFMKEYNNLLFLKILNAGHMVPMDVSEVALDMMRTFVQGESFQVSKQNLDMSATGGSCPICISTCPDCPVCPSLAPGSDKDDDAQKECPECEICNSTSSLDTTAAAPSSSSSLSGSANANKVVGGMIVAALIAALASVLLYARHRRQNRGLTPLPAYDLEMRETQYQDAPDVNLSNGKGKDVRNRMI